MDAEPWRQLTLSQHAHNEYLNANPVGACCIARYARTLKHNATLAVTCAVIYPVSKNKKPASY